MVEGMGQDHGRAGSGNGRFWCRVGSWGFVRRTTGRTGLRQGEKRKKGFVQNAS